MVATTKQSANNTAAKVKPRPALAASTRKLDQIVAALEVPKTATSRCPASRWSR